MTKPTKKLFFHKCLTYPMGYLVVIFLLLNSCGKNVAPTHIPSEANIVAVLDFENLSSKAASWQEMLEYAFGEASETDADIIDFLTHSGIDLSKSAYLFGDLNPNSPQKYLALSFDLNDANQFKESLSKNYQNIQNEATFSYIIDQSVVIGWQEKRALVLNNYSGEEEILSKFKELFDTSDEESLEVKNEEFYSLLKKDYDMAVWLNSKQFNSFQDELTKLLKGELPDEVIELGQISQSFSATFHFENGKIISEHNTKLDEKIWSKYEKLFEEKADPKLIQQLPTKHPAFLLNTKLDNQELREVLDEANMLKLLKQVGGLFNITPEEIFDFITGDMVFMLNEFRMEVGMKPYSEYLFGLKIQDRPKLDKFLSKLNGLFMDKKDNYYVIKLNNQRFYMIEIDDLLYVSNSESLIKKINNSPGELSLELINAGKGHISMVYTDLTELQKMVPLQDIGNLPGLGIEREEWISIFESFQITTDQYEENIAAGKMELSLKDKNQNALMVIIDLIRKTSGTPKPI